MIVVKRFRASDLSPCSRSGQGPGTSHAGRAALLRDFGGRHRHSQGVRAFHLNLGQFALVFSSRFLFSVLWP